MLTERDALASYNERVKLFAGFSNAIGLGLIGFALLRPLTADMTSIGAAGLWWGATGLAFHAGAHYILTRIRRRAGP